MAKKTRRSGIFDPDYRRKGWNQSAFAPKNSTISISKVSLAIVVFLFIGLYILPATKPAMMTMPGLTIAFIGGFILWITLALLLRRWAWRRVQKRIRPKQPEPMTFESDSPSIKTQTIKSETKSQATTQPPIDPIQQQLATRKQRLQGQVEAHKMTPTEFEHEVAWVINMTTPNKAVVTGGAGDGGVDIKVYDGKRFVGIVQCKKLDPKKALPPGYIRELATVKQQQGVEIAYLVTTAKVSRATEHEAKKLGIKIIDGDDYEQLRKQAQTTRHR